MDASRQKKIEDFQQGGCVTYPIYDLIGSKLLKATVQSIHKSIQICSADIQVDTRDYLRATSRWHDPSPVTAFAKREVLPIIQANLEDLFDESLTLSKINVIIKSPWSNSVIPCHQDIAYSQSDPYEFSFWLALTNVGLDDGALSFIPKSHLWPIEPAVDFWQPDYIDSYYKRFNWCQESVSFALKAGEGVLFDSSIWHRSDTMQNNHYRIALVSRWKRQNFIPRYQIPEKKSNPFGMWTCGQVTKKLLAKGLKKDFDTDLLDLLEMWIKKIHLEQLPFDLYNQHKALIDMKNLFVLHQAATRHQGGDAFGLVYAYAWKSFLAPLSRYLNN